MGEVAVELHSDVPERLRERMLLWLLTEAPGRRELEVEKLWPHKGHLVLKFAGVDSIAEAETLVGCELQVPRSQRIRLESGQSYVSDLIGCVVFNRELEVGRIENVRFGAGEAPLLVVKAGLREYEVPYAEAYLTTVDVEGRKIHMVLPEGMLDLNAPLTAEEKREQSAGRSARRRR